MRSQAGPVTRISRFVRLDSRDENFPYEHTTVSDPDETFLTKYLCFRNIAAKTGIILCVLPLQYANNLY